MRLLAGTLGGRPLSLAEHVAVHGPFPARAEVVLEDAGLRGRGGAGFPVARKLATARAARRGGVVLVNATESEPASLKDEVLAGKAPHLVIDGALLAAKAVRAREVVIAIHEGSAVEPVLRAALVERCDASHVRLLQVPARYVSGEASALVSAWTGGPALPFHRELPLAESGPRRRPAVVLNAESVAGLALLARHGAGWYRQVGTPEEPGTVLLTVRRTGSDPTVLEVPLGTPLEEALGTAGVDAASLQAVLVGGWFGRWLPAPTALSVRLSHAGLRAVGGVLGAGLVIGLGHDECGLRTSAQVLRRLAGESAGQCGPCVNGLPALARAMEDVVAGFDVPDALSRAVRYRAAVSGRGLCGLPDGAADLAASALDVFAADVTVHAAGGCGLPSCDAVGLAATTHAASTA